MSITTPPNRKDLQRVILDRLKALDEIKGAQETVTIEWRGSPRAINVISMPLDLLYYNPDTHRVRAQRTIDPVREKFILSEPLGMEAQAYLHDLLKGDPADPAKIDNSFIELKEDLRDHGQGEPGIITRDGVLINGNTRRAALKELGLTEIRVGVLPQDAGYEDFQTVELSLQLRKDHKRDYSFMNLLLALEERSSQPVPRILADFRMNQKTYEKYIWILQFIKNAIERSRVALKDGTSTSLRLIDFENDKSKLEELHRAFVTLKADSPDKAESLKEERLLALVFDKSKTDLRFIESGFMERYMKEVIPEPAGGVTQVKIPGMPFSLPGKPPEVEALGNLVTKVLQAKAIKDHSVTADPSEVTNANEFLSTLREKLDKALDLAGKTGRVQKRQMAVVERISDACDHLDQAREAVANARATANFDPIPFDEALVALKTSLARLAKTVNRGDEGEGEGISWLRKQLPNDNG